MGMYIAINVCFAGLPIKVLALKMMESFVYPKYCISTILNIWNVCYLSKNHFNSDPPSVPPSTFTFYNEMSSSHLYLM